MRWNCMSKALHFLQITAKQQYCPFFTVFLTIKTLSQNISITLLQISLKLHEHRGGYWREKLPWTILEEQFPLTRYTAASKIGHSVISLLWQPRCRCNPDRNKSSSLCNTTVVAIFPKSLIMAIYKITKYAHSDCLRRVFAWEYVSMVVASRCFAFRTLITQARTWNSFQVQNSTSLLYLPIPSSAETWKIVTKKVCQVFFTEADILSEKSPFFGKHLFADFATGKNFSSNQCHTKSFAFYLGKFIL